MQKNSVLIQNLFPFIGFVGILGVYLLRYSGIRPALLLVSGFLLGVVIEKMGVFFSEYTRHSRSLLSIKTLQALGAFLFTKSADNQYSNPHLTGLLLASYLPLAVFLVTSGGSFIGLGTILGWGWWYCVQFWKYRMNHEVLLKKYWEPLPIHFPQLGMKQGMFGFVMFYLVVVLFGLR